LQVGHTNAHAEQASQRTKNKQHLIINTKQQTCALNFQFNTTATCSL